MLHIHTSPSAAPQAPRTPSVPVPASYPSPPGVPRLCAFLCPMTQRQPSVEPASARRLAYHKVKHARFRRLVDWRLLRALLEQTVELSDM